MEIIRFPKYARTQITWKISNVSAEAIERSSSTLETSVFQINIKNQDYGCSATKWYEKSDFKKIQ